MTLTIEKLGRTFAGEVKNVDLAGELDETTVAAVKQAWWDHSVLVFRDQKLSVEQHLAFSRHFGDLQGHTVTTYLLPEHPEVLVLSNRGRGGTTPLKNGGAYWHSDITYEAVPPMGSILHGLTVPPEGGNTLYADMYAAYEALDDETKALIDGRQAIHNYSERYLRMARGGARPMPTAKQLAEWQDVEHPIVLTHPESQRKALYVNEGFTVSVKGLDPEASKTLLARLFAHSSQERFIYSHRWHPGDIVMWDNRCTMHCATPYDSEKYERTMHRTTIRGTANLAASP